MAPTTAPVAPLPRLRAGSCRTESRTASQPRAKQSRDFLDIFQHCPF